MAQLIFLILIVLPLLSADTLDAYIYTGSETCSPFSDYQETAPYAAGECTSYPTGGLYMIASCNRGHCYLPENSCPSSPVGGPCGAYDITYNTYSDAACTKVLNTDLTWCSGPSCMCGPTNSAFPTSMSIAWTCSNGYPVPTYDLACCTTAQENCYSAYLNDSSACAADPNCAVQGTNCITKLSCLGNENHQWILLANAYDTMFNAEVNNCMNQTSEASCVAGGCEWCPGYFESFNCAYKTTLPTVQARSFTPDYTITWTTTCPSSIINWNGSASRFETSAMALILLTLCLVMIV